MVVHRMPIRSNNSDAALLLLELHTQCMLISRSFEYLCEAAIHWKNISNGIDDGRIYPPIEIVARCTVYLSGMTAIRNLLFENKRKKPIIINRCSALKGLLGHPNLPILSSTLVRNSWEHLDERLDNILPTNRGHPIEPIRIAPGKPDPNDLSIKRFDPNDISIWFLNQRISLPDCQLEIELISKRIDEAFNLLQVQHYRIY